MTSRDPTMETQTTGATGGAPPPAATDDTSSLDAGLSWFFTVLDDTNRLPSLLQSLLQGEDYRSYDWAVWILPLDGDKDPPSLHVWLKFELDRVCTEEHFRQALGAYLQQQGDMRPLRQFGGAAIENRQRRRRQELWEWFDAWQPRLAPAVQRAQFHTQAVERAPTEIFRNHNWLEGTLSKDGENDGSTTVPVMELEELQAAWEGPEPEWTTAQIQTILDHYGHADGQFLTQEGLRLAIEHGVVQVAPDFGGIVSFYQEKIPDE